jgi:predicted RNase H-like HicB family nuclease
MKRSFTLEYWMEDGSFVGRLKEVPGVFCQGGSLEELEKCIKEGYKAMMAKEGMPAPGKTQTKEIELDV